MTKQKIIITEQGPYLVSGNVPLSEKIIVHHEEGYVFEEGRPLPQAEAYALCRCGKSKNPPFCDGSHETAVFDGVERASKADFTQRIVDTVEGPELTLLDDGRCAFTRFCHRRSGDVWTLTANSDNPRYKKEAIRAACDFPAGRLVIIENEGNILEPDYEPAIEILQDPEKGASGPIFVKGNIPIEAVDGSTYEIRNRVTLCRCGKSRIKPFCDAAHITIGYKG